MRKQLFSLVSAMLCVLTLLPTTAFAQTSSSTITTSNSVYPSEGSTLNYTDVSADDWFYHNVEFVTTNGLMNGTEAGKFSPAISMTRAMLVTALWRMEDEPVMGNGKSGTFPDVPEYVWYTEAIEWAAAYNFIYGYPHGNFGPTDNLSRQDTVVILYRYAQYKGYDVTVGEGTNILSYGDAFAISEYAIPAVQWACAEGLIRGYNGNLTPTNAAQRAQATAILQRFIENVAT